MSSTRVHNFGAGPATLPLPVLERAAADLVELDGKGMSVGELSHRSAEFRAIAESTEAKLRALLGVPPEYRVLFLHGPSRLQFAAVPLNLLQGKRSADYVETGLWSVAAVEEARRFCRVNVAASSREGDYTYIPCADRWQLDPDAAYVYYTPNETIGGVEFHRPIDVGDVPLVADMTSTLLSRPIDVTRFGLIFAGAQKNIGIAGLTLVIVREDLLGRAAAHTPSMLDYQVHATGGSLTCTPPTFGWHLAGLVFDWIEEQGGLEALGRTNRRKAQTLYRFIDGSNFYSNPVAESCRSWMNVPFRLADDGLDATFLAEAKQAGLAELKGHRFIGGMRASLYNAMPESGVDALVEFMRDFMERHG